MRINVNLGENSHDVLIGENVERLGEILKDLNIGEKILVVSNHKVNSLHGETVVKSLKESGFDVSLKKIGDNERVKNLGTVKGLYKTLVELEMDRSSTILSLGGGVVGDVSGFVASTFMRGINLVHVPTTLLAQVDSSIGGKTGVDFVGKNLIGSFHQPKIVLSDVRLLKTLDGDELRNGLAEVVKSSMIGDARLLKLVNENVDEIMNCEKGFLEEIVKRAAKVKIGIVEQDEREIDQRMLLNFGHTIGHGIESVSKFKIQHGRAVAVGMILESQIAEKMGLIDSKPVRELEELIERIGIRRVEIRTEKVITKLMLDKKSKNRTIRMALPEKVGKVGIRSVDEELIREVLEGSK